MAFPQEITTQGTFELFVWATATSFRWWIQICLRDIFHYLGTVLKRLRIEGNSSPASFLVSLLIRHIRASLSPPLSSPLPSSSYTPDRKGEARWGAAEAAASLRAESPLLWSSTADVITDGTSLPRPKRPSESSLWIQAVLISLIFISSLKKKTRTKGPKKKKKCFVSQNATESLLLTPNEEFHYQEMKQFSSATCLCAVWAALSKGGWGWARVPLLCQAHSF